MAVDITQYNSTEVPTWCAGCGNFTIHLSIKKALSDMDISPDQVYISFDIGCNGNGADKINVYGFKGLHGRAIPLAIGAHIANRKFNVIADLGDGACLHEGIDHLIHAIRSNYDITILIHNNGNFALTTGQATATTPEGKKMYGLPDGRPEREINIGEFVINQKPSFYARAYSSDAIGTTEIIKSAIKHKGCSVVEIMQLCPTYNKEYNNDWFNKRIVKIDKSTKDIDEARKLVDMSDDKIHTGVIFQDDSIPDFYSKLENRVGKKSELVDEVDNFDVSQLFKYLE